MSEVATVLPYVPKLPRHHLSPPQRCQHCSHTGHHYSTCLARTSSFPTDSVLPIRCIHCYNHGHCTCTPSRKLPPNPVFCCKCGQKGHFGEECMAEKRDKLRTFRRNVEDYMDLVVREFEGEDLIRPQTNKEKRYWEKVANKAFKKAKRMRKEHRNRP